MKKVIYKYVLQPGETEHRMPKRAEILSAEVQGIDIVVWAMHDFPDDKTEYASRLIVAIPTGATFEGLNGRFVKTIQIAPPAVTSFLVFHIFDLGEKPERAVS